MLTVLNWLWDYWRKLSDFCMKSKFNTNIDNNNYHFFLNKKQLNTETDSCQINSSQEYVIKLQIHLLYQLLGMLD